MVAIRYYPCPVDYLLLTTDIFTTIGERRSAKPNFLWITNMSQDLQIKEHRDSNVDKHVATFILNNFYERVRTMRAIENFLKSH